MNIFDKLTKNPNLKKKFGGGKGRGEEGRRVVNICEQVEREREREREREAESDMMTLFTCHNKKPITH